MPHAMHTRKKIIDELRLPQRYKAMINVHLAYTLLPPRNLPRY
jgi:hypothetical protein